jgi:hypothetical protein
MFKCGTRSLDLKTIAGGQYGVKPKRLPSNKKDF